MTRRLAVRCLLFALVPCLGFAVRPAPGPVEPRLLAGLVWRNVGPFRAGRVTAVSCAIGQPGVCYMGTPIGGLWKTTSAGVTWFPVFDSVTSVSSIGAVEVAPSDPDVVYVGTGSTNDGDGVYKSTDAGRTWRHLGLDSTRRIAKLIVDPRDPNVVIMAVLGNPRGPDRQRGIFRSADGGRTWRQTLYVDSATGASDLAYAFDQPDVILASVHHTLGFSIGGGVGGPGGPGTTRLYKSVDDGVTWTEVRGGGLGALTGRVSVAVAMHTGARRMFAVGGSSVGLWRSDDGGATWRRMAADDERIANGYETYTSGVWVNTASPDTVYTIATAVYKSADGGAHFTGWKGSPGGDDPQVFWFDPTDPRRMLIGLDQGAQVSLDGGETWSSWDNQSTEQIYHISVEPGTGPSYWIYATQQDACAVQVRNRGDWGEVSMLDWSPNPGFERGAIVQDPLHKGNIYALNMTAGIMKITQSTGFWHNIAPNIDTSLQLRGNGDQPLLFNPANPRELLTGYQYLMATTDGGARWTRLSPDLTLPRAGAGVEPGARGRGASGSITTLAASAVAPGVVWVGTSNGQIQVTRNHGATWTNVSVDGVGGSISSVEASHFAGGEAFVALRARNEYTPSFYRTRDYGATWTKIVDGLPTDQVNGSFAHVVREDPRQRGLLFAGTESAIWVSFDDGDHWQSLMLNLPTTSFRDIVIRDNDLIVCTYGRGIWILDDISPLRQLTPDVAQEAVHLFKPGDAWRIRRDVNGDTPLQAETPHAENPPVGAVIYYSLASRPSGDITLEILDAAGHVVRRMSSAPLPPRHDPPPPVADFWLAVPQPMPVNAGLNRVHWDIRYDDPPAFNHNIGQQMGSVPHESEYTPQGPLALPGTYTARLTVDGHSYEQRFTVKNDSRSPATAADLAAQHALQMKLYQGSQVTWDGWHQAQAARDAIAQVVRGNPGADVTQAAAKLDSAIAAVAGDPTPIGNFAEVTGPPNFASLNGREPGESIPLESMNGQLRTTDYGDMAPNEAMMAAWRQACAALHSAVGTWTAINQRDLPAFNRLLAGHNLPAIQPASPALEPPACGPAAAPLRRSRR